VHELLSNLEVLVEMASGPIHGSLPEIFHHLDLLNSVHGAL
jgi:hypothetical protein